MEIKVEDAECELLDHIISGADDLGSSNATIVEIIGSRDVGILISENTLDYWVPLTNALDEAARIDTSTANALREKTENSNGQKLARRAFLANADKAAQKDKNAEKLFASSAALRASLDYVAAARTALSAEESRASAAEGKETASPSSGPLSIALKELLRKYNIMTQAYWAGTMVGPDARRFLQHFPEIFTEMREFLVPKIGEAEADAWIERKTSTLKELAIVCHYTRAARILTLEERALLRAACEAYPKAFRLAFPARKIVPPKVHYIEKHIMPIVDMFGTIGIFGDDGLESFHPVDSRARLIVRSMRNSVERHKAMINNINKVTKGKSCK